jgi:hypothetical protein
MDIYIHKTSTLKICLLKHRYGLCIMIISIFLSLKKRQKNSKFINQFLLFVYLYQSVFSFLKYVVHFELILDVLQFLLQYYLYD